ncbi:MAG: DEAD/DEAH box helicase, partial [Pyrinomonadaceae bacterium]
MIYKDLEKNTEKIASHKIFNQMINKDGPTYIGLPEGITKLSLDEYFAPEKSLQVVDADSSQLRAIATVSQNYDLVLEGPPGTGKSQTITNLIAHALSTGKKVLFVAEKMAALDVVYRRLRDVGLGEFCLELHSTKANKRSVMQELKNALDMSLERVEPSQAATTRLPLVREHLNDYVKAVHTPYGALATSPYIAFGEVDAVRSAKKQLFQGNITGVTRDAFDDILRDLSDLVAAAEPIGSPNDHAWRGAEKTFYSEADLDAIKQGAELALSKLTSIAAQAETLEKRLGLPKLRTFADLDIASEVAETIARSPGAPLKVLANEAWNSSPPEAIALIDEGKRIQSIRSKLLESYKETVFDLDPSDEAAYVKRKSEGLFSFLSILDGRYRAARRRWIGLRIAPDAMSMADQAIDMRTVADYLSRRSMMSEQQSRGTEYFGPLWQGEASNWTALDRYIEWVVDFRRIYVARGLNEAVIATASDRSPDVTFVQELRDLASELKDLLYKLSSLVGWRDNHFQDGYLDFIWQRLSEVAGDIDGSHKWAAYEAVRQRIERSFASEILEWIGSGQIEFPNLIPVFKRSFFQKWITNVVQERAELREFHTLSHEERVREFRRLDELVLNQNRLKLIGQMRGVVQSTLQQSPFKEQMLTLRTQLNRQRGLLPLRTTMLNCLDAVRAIKPCFMMSPQSVAQLLDAEKDKFDLVIFDEASQLPTEDAVGAVFRGDQLVVVGDPKQLPPTNFFAVTSGQVNVQLDDDGLPLFDDSQSILEEMMSSGFPSSRLKWHYRSSHESLITFSNSTFYNSDLYTFPSVESEAFDSVLQFAYVPYGIYEGIGLNII